MRRRRRQRRRRQRRARRARRRAAARAAAAARTMRRRRGRRRLISVSLGGWAAIGPAAPRWLAGAAQRSSPPPPCSQRCPAPPACCARFRPATPPPRSPRSPRRQLPGAAAAQEGRGGVGGRPARLWYPLRGGGCRWAGAWPGRVLAAEAGRCTLPWRAAALRRARARHAWPMRGCQQGWHPPRGPPTAPRAAPLPPRQVPFVATREGYRREGHCRRLMGALEGLLHGVGIRWVIVPAMKGAPHAGDL